MHPRALRRCLEYSLIHPIYYILLPKELWVAYKYMKMIFWIHCCELRPRKVRKEMLSVQTSFVQDAVADCSPIKTLYTLSIISSRFMALSKQYGCPNNKNDLFQLWNYDSSERRKKWDGQNGRNSNRAVNGGYSVTSTWQRRLLEWRSNGAYRKLLTRSAGSDWFQWVRALPWHCQGLDSV